MTDEPTNLKDAIQKLREAEATIDHLHKLLRQISETNHALVMEFVTRNPEPTPDEWTPGTAEEYIKRSPMSNPDMDPELRRRMLLGDFGTVPKDEDE